MYIQYFLFSKISSSHYIQQSHIKSGNEVVYYWTYALYVCTTTNTMWRGQLLLKKNPGVFYMSEKHSCCHFLFFLSLIWGGILTFSEHGSFIFLICTFMLKPMCTKLWLRISYTYLSWLHYWCYSGLLPLSK